MQAIHPSLTYLIQKAQTNFNKLGAEDLTSDAMRRNLELLKEMVKEDIRNHGFSMVERHKLYGKVRDKFYKTAARKKKR